MAEIIIELDPLDAAALCDAWYGDKDADSYRAERAVRAIETAIEAAAVASSRNEAP